MTWLGRAQASGEFTQAEMEYLIFQYGHPGSFTAALFEAIARADAGNRVRLSLGFPEEVDAYRAWTMGDLADRARKFWKPKGDAAFNDAPTKENIDIDDEEARA